MPTHADHGGAEPTAGRGLRPSDDELLAAAVEYAEHHWRIIPLFGKAPAIPSAHPAGIRSDCCVVPPTSPDPLRGKCKGGCDRLGHGYYDATDDVDTVIEWWSGRYKGRNIGAQIPESMLLIDIDPRTGGDKSWTALEQRYTPRGINPSTLGQGGQATGTDRDTSGSAQGVRSRNATSQ